jgi:eukaryotic-like serine/threonine-protein kinase
MTLESENWQLLQELFHLAEATPVADRERILAERCPDERLRRRALDLVAAAESDDPIQPPPANSMPGNLTGKIGPYSLIRPLGAGGIGSVYLVERIVGGAVQRSAVKVLAPHSAGPAFVERFHREEHILASLDHPNITRMLDAGVTESGQPYLVMEYVDGVHLDLYCDQRKLDVAERLRLFLHVCEAVSYAHRNLVVHLDLKPSNILVAQDGAGSGVVKLLDFGTSKLIQPDAMLTTTVMATPAYASPEQLRNEPVTTSCDIYALGAILFELLAGRRPFEASSAAAMIERALREQEPERAASAVTGAAAERRGVSEQRLRQMLAGDLGTIAQKCLNPRPGDRYASVDALREDVERYLDGRPVLARPQTMLYRAGKFIRRNRVSVTATTVAALALAAALVYAGWRQQEALREGQRALRMQTFMVQLFRLANSDYTGKPAATVPELLDLGVQKLPEYIKDPSDLRAAQIRLAESMFENGDLDAAQRVFTQTIATARADGDINGLAESEAYAGDIAYMQGQTDLGAKLTSDALQLSKNSSVSPAVRIWSEVYYAYNRENMGFRADENLSLLQDAAKRSREDKLPARDTADVAKDLADDLDLRGRLDEAEYWYKQALAIYEQDPLALCDQSETYGDLGSVTEMRGDVQASLPLYQRAYEGYKACSGSESRGALDEIDYRAGALIKLGRAKEAVPLLEAAMPAWRRIAPNSPDLAEPLYYLSRAYVQTGRYQDGEKMAQELVACQEGKVAPTDRRFGASHMIWAEALAGQHRYQDALPHAQIADKLLAINAVSAGAKQMEAEAHQVLLDVQSKSR